MSDAIATPGNSEPSTTSSNFSGVQLSASEAVPERQGRETWQASAHRRKEPSSYGQDYGNPKPQGGQTIAYQESIQRNSMQSGLPTTPAFQPLAEQPDKASRSDDRLFGTVNMSDMHQTILIVDDEAAIIDVLETYLRDEGFRVLRALDGKAAVDLALRERPDLILLDLTLPKLPGLRVFSEIRRHHDIPIIMLTSRGAEVDRVVGLELGADDYVSKPFSPREVLARVKSVLRRRMPLPKAATHCIESVIHDVQRVGDLTIDRTTHEVTRDGHAIGLTPTEFRLLEVFADHPGQAFTRDHMIDLVSKDGSELLDRTLDRHIANLRAKIEVNAQRPRYIQTVQGIGYRLANFT